MMTFYSSSATSILPTHISNSSLSTRQQDRLINDELANYLNQPISIQSHGSHNLADIELLTAIAETQTSLSRASSYSECMTLETPSTTTDAISPLQNAYRPRSVDLQHSLPQSYFNFGGATYDQPVGGALQDAGAQALVWSAQSDPSLWSMYSRTADISGMGAQGYSPVEGLKRQRSHQRTPSASTIASNGPASPYSYSSGNPQIANTDFAPTFDHSPLKDISGAQQFDPAYLSASYIPGQAAQLKGFAPFNAHHSFDDFAAQITSSARPMTDSDSSLTPASVAPEELEGVKTGGQQRDDEDNAIQRENAGLHRPTPGVQLLRTESAAFQDELYNPANFSTPKSAPKPANAKAISALPPAALRTLVNQRLETANMARSASPASAVSRERSPFREGSHFASSEGWSSPRNPMVSAATRRQQFKEEREQAEYAAHRPQLQREPTKTISPKDALLDYNEPDQPSLFQDTVPAGYQQHLGGEDGGNGNTSADSYTNAYLTQPNASAAVTALPVNGQVSMPGFRATSADGFVPNFNFSPPSSQTANTSAPAVSSIATTTAMQNPYQISNAYQQVGMNQAFQNNGLLDPTPEFPATLTSMESSISDQGMAMSSQDSANVPLARPADTRANTGTYTCTYHGCTQRFDTPAALQRHKRDFHRSHQQQQVHQQHREALSQEASSASPRSTESPGPISNAGLTSAQILARNSQAGPHKCTRINPSTGKPCNTIFSRPYDLTRHEDTIHNNRKQKVRCPYCREEKTFSRNDALTRHMRVVHPDVDSFGKRGRRD